MSLVLFIGVSFCSYRLWKLLAKDVIFDRPRKWFYRRFPPNPATAQLVHAQGVHKLGMMIACPWCSGFYISGLVVLAVSQWISMQMPVLWWFATSSVDGLLAKMFD